MASAKSVLGVTAIAITLTVPGLGRAQSCATDADCAQGLRCQDDPTPTSVSVVCRLVDGGEVCTTSEEPPSPPTRSCQLAPCTNDGDCGSGMVCYHATETVCTGGAPTTEPCTVGMDCPTPPPPEPETCTENTISLCAYRWMLPCNADADCGTGFLCKPSEIGTCSGSSGTAPASGGGTASEGTGGAAGGTDIADPMPVDAGPAPTVTCTTITSYPGYCQATVTSCTADSDCPAPWTCQSTYATTPSTPTVTAPPATRPAAIDGGAAAAEPPPDLTAPAVQEKTCQPPSTIYVTRGGGEDTGGIPITIPTQGTDVDGGTPISKAPSVPDGGASQGATTPPNPTPPGAGNSEPTTETVASTSGGGGCSVGAGQRAPGSAWLLLVGFGLLVAWRRRAR